MESNEWMNKGKDANNNNTKLDRGRLTRRGIDEFIGLCKGILIDGEVTFAEAENLLFWLFSNPLVANNWIAKDLHDHLRLSIIDGEFSSENQSKLLAILMAIISNPDAEPVAQNASTSLPIDSPAPLVKIIGRSYCLTGNFEYGKRADVEALILERGGVISKKNVTALVDFLVVGNIGSEAWLHSSFGRKIDEAVTQREKHGRVAIVSESHFFEHIFNCNVVPQNNNPEAAFESAVTAFSDELQSLANTNLHIEYGETVVGIFRPLKSGKLPKHPTVMLFFNEETSIKKWTVSGRSDISYLTSYEGFFNLIEVAKKYE